MLSSLFIIDSKGDIIIERHWRGRISRSVGEEFWRHVKSSEPQETLPVIATPGHYLIHVFRYNLFFVGVVTQETQPLLVTELLNNFVQILHTYLGGSSKVSDVSIKQHFTTIYQLLDEMIDNGYPITTELSLLTDLVKPPQTSLQALTSGALKARGNARSPVPWRKLGIKYTNNEVYFDVIEEVNCIVDASNATLRAEVIGRIMCNCRLSGMPDILLRFQDPQILKDCAFHPCVRYARFEQDQSLSFVPPDGEFELMRYRNDDILKDLPVYCRSQIHVYSGGGSLNIMLNGKQRSLDDVAVVIPLNEPILTQHLSASQGTLLYDDRLKQLKWKIGKVEPKKSVSLGGQFSTTTSGADIDVVGAIRVLFRMTSFCASGIKVEKVEIREPNLKKPFKGVRYLTFSGGRSNEGGGYEVRTI
mmetsp:Transcript_9461/g.35117  ORF Transcript_9461/g.35117 Transcript_9461/m.35117 type:complete len:418 (-) Transcript_9461:127-1380(-)